MSSSSYPCAACKFLQCNCTQGCVFAPYFPADQHRFSNVFRIFGASNVANMLNRVSPEHRKDVANSLAYQASMRLIDPIYGCVGEILELQEEIRQKYEILELQERICDFLKRVLAWYVAADVAAARAAVIVDDAAVSIGHQFTPPPMFYHQPQQQQEDYNYLAPASPAFASPSQMLYHPQQQQEDYNYHHPQQQQEDYNYLAPASAAPRQMLLANNPQQHQQQTYNYLAAVQTSGVRIGNADGNRAVCGEPTITTADAPDADEPTITASDAPDADAPDSDEPTITASDAPDAYAPDSDEPTTTALSSSLGQLFYWQKGERGLPEQK